MTRPTTPFRLRTVLFAAILGFSTFAVEAAPTDIPLPRPEALTPDPVKALACADEAEFTGRLTSSKTSTSAITRSTTGNVYAYISRVDDNWSCTAYYRYDGVVWSRSTTGANGNWDWGNLINSTSVSCNWVIGETNYVKANSSTDCHDSDGEYAMPIFLAHTSGAGSLLEGTYHNDIAPDEVGDFGFIHSDCTSYYGGESSSWNEPFQTSNVDSRPGDNCDPYLLEPIGINQTIVVDETPPTLSFSAPAGAPGTVVGTTAGSYGVTFNPSDNVANFGATHPWSLQRQIAPNTGGGTCGAFVNDPAAGNVVTGTTEGSQSDSQALVAGTCYRWVLSASDMNGNTATPLTSATVIRDSTAPTVSFVSPMTGSTISRNTTAFSVSWTETEIHSGVSTRSLQRQRVAATSPACPGTFTNDGTAVTTASPSSQTLTTGYCYQWVQTLTDKAGNTSSGASATSGKVYVDTTTPMADFSTPNEATTTFQTSTGYSVAWSETAGSGSITARSLTRYRTAFGAGACPAIDLNGTPDDTFTSASPNSATLSAGYCYQWVQTLTNSGGKTGATSSGIVVVDTTAPTGTITYPEANRPVAGTVTISGTASDAGSFKEYQLEYGAGASPSSWTTIGTFTSPVTSAGPLATWATGSLSGEYTLRLTVRENASATTSVTTRTVYLENARRGTESYYTRVPYDLGGGLTLDVGVANGEARLARDLFSIPSYGPPQELSLTYSSLETGATGQFGVGWSSNLTQYLSFDVTNGVTVWHRADGGRVPFGLLGSTWTPLRGHFETMTVSGGEVTITTTDQTSYVFEDSGGGRLKRITDRFGNSLTMSWSSGSATATDASGRATSITIADSSGTDRITGVTDSAGRSWVFGYTGTGANSDLTTITDPASKVTTLGYTSHVLTTVSRVRTKAAGGTETPVWTVAYSTGKVSGVSDPELSTPNTFTYGASSTTVNTVVDETGPEYAPRTYRLDDLGNGTVVAEAATADLETGEADTLTRTFDADLNLTSETVPTDDPDHPAVTSFIHDASGNVLSQTDPIDATTSVTTVNTYNATNDLLTRTDADDDAATRTVTKYTYDGSGHLTSVNLNCTSSGTTIPAQGAGGTCTGAGTQDASTNVITEYAYTADDQLESERDPLGRVTRHVYDTWGNETSTVADCTSSGTSAPSPWTSCTAAGTHDAQTNVTSGSTFDQAVIAGKAGLPTKATDALGRDTTYTYDALGRQLTEVLPGDASVPVPTRTSTWDELGNPLTEADSWTPTGGSLQTRTTTHVYDLADRETSLTDPAGLKAVTTYAPDGTETTVEERDTGGSVTQTTTNDYDLLPRLTQSTRTGAGGAGTSLATSVAFDGGVRAATRTVTVAPSNVATVTRTDFAGRTIEETTTPDPEDPLAGVSTEHTYDRLGRELTSTDEQGVVTTNTYDRLGRLLTTTVDGATTTHAYDRAGNEGSVIDPDGTVTTTTVDPLDRATTVIVNDVASPTLPGEDVTTTTSYDAAGNAIAVTDPTGITSRTIINAQDQASQTIANCTDTGTTPTSDPAACTGGGTHSDTANVVTNLTYDGQGSVVASEVADGRPAEATSETAYDDGGRVQATKDPRGTITRNKYDTAGRLTDVYVNCTTSGTTIPSDWINCTGGGTADGTHNLRTIHTYDADGNQATVTAPNGRVTTSVYDEAGRLSKTIDNDVASATLPGEDVTTEYHYDELDRQVATRTPTANGTATIIRKTILNDDGSVASEIRNCTDSGTTTPADEAAALACTGAGTKDAETNVTTSYLYDDRGNRIRSTVADPSATSGTSTATVTTQYAFDEADRLCRVAENATVSTDLQALADPCATATQTAGTATTNVSTRYTYDGAGNLASMIDAAGHTTTYAYDAAGRPTGRTDALGESLVWRYDDAGNRIRQENRSDAPLSASVTWTHDAAGRELTRVADGVTTTTTYDANGNRLTVGDGTFTITTTYDRLDRPLTIDDEDAGTTADTTYTYSLTSPTRVDVTGTYGFTLDRFDRATAVNDPVMGSDFTWAYRADGLPAMISRPDGNYTEPTFSKLGHQTGSDTDTSATTGGTDRAVYAWTHNRAGQILTENSTVTGDPANGTVTYGYDPLGRLASSALSGTTTTYGWDTVTNRTSVQVGGGSTATTAFDAADRPTSGSNPTAAFTSDDDGRLLTRPGQQLVWDRLGRLTGVKDGGGTTLATYTYDPLDRLRMIDYGAGVRVRFRYVGLLTAAAQLIDDAAGTVTRSVGTGWSGERLLDWTGSGSNIRLYGENGHHDVTWLATNTGTVSQALRYDPWGSPRSSVPSGYTPFRFQGSYLDATTDLAWVVTRWYAPTLGRFVSEDSLLGEPLEPPSRHLYAYGQGEPVARWDPDGRRPGSSGGQCGVLGLQCGVASFDMMSARTRLAWLRQFQATHQTQGWFNAIEAVLDFASDHNVITPGKSWFSKVDAYILKGIQDGKRLQLKWKVRGTASNRLARNWQRFFEALDDGRSTNTLKFLWGTAEQAATNFGVDNTSRRSRFAERLIKSVTDLWRASVGSLNRTAKIVENHYCVYFPFFKDWTCNYRVVTTISAFVEEHVFNPRRYKSTRILAPMVWKAGVELERAGF